MSALRLSLTAASIFFASLFAGTASAQSPDTPRTPVPHVRHQDLLPTDSVLNDVYVKLYLARLRSAKFAVERSKQELAMSIRTRDRAERLYRTHSSSAEELEIARTATEVAALRVQEAQADADQAETFVDIAVSRISIGLAMPICAEIR